MAKTDTVTAAQLDGWFESISNWGRWGDDDQRGALNLITDAKRAEAASLVREGAIVSCAQELPKRPAPDNPTPVIHAMQGAGDVTRGGGGGASDMIAINPHGYATTHLDALCHIFHNDRMYNGYPASMVTSLGARLNSIEGGGFLFAMCTATETLELALAAADTDIAASFADGSPPDAAASDKLYWADALAFRDAVLVTDPTLSAFSDIDGHQVNTPWRVDLGSFSLFEFSAKFDPVPAMLTQNHRRVLPDFYGLTTTFRRERLQPGVTVLAEEDARGRVKYLHGSFGEGTFTYLGGHDPEDPRHLIGDAPTDLDLHRHSAGYRLILNNVLFPAAKKKKLIT